MLILGGGIIGLEMGTVYSTLGARLDVVEMMDGLMQGADRDLVKVWQKMNAKRFDNIMLKTKTVGARALPEGIEVTFAPAQEGGTVPAPQVYDLVLQAVGRSPNGNKIGADKAGVVVSDRGFIPVDIQMRTNVAHIFAIGDIVGQHLCMINSVLHRFEADSPLGPWVPLRGAVPNAEHTGAIGVEWPLTGTPPSQAKPLRLAGASAATAPIRGQ